MSFGFGGNTGFGASPFGSSAPAFGAASAPAFGASPFGAQPAGGVFGQQQSQPAFGAAAPSPFGAPAQPAPGAFGAPIASQPAFGSGGFGAAAPSGGFGFGGAASAPSPFGAATSTPAFGAAPQSAPAFGAASTPAFGAAPSPFGAAPAAGGFGAPQSQPAFGAASTPAFGQTLSAFGSSAFGAAAPGSGGFATPAFGGPAQRGTRGVAWRKTQETDTSGTSGAKTTVYYNSISCMPEYSGKSPEELRWEDYQDGVKGGMGTPPSTGGTGLFGSPSPSPSPFGAPAASTPSPFGAPQQSAPAFGAPQSAPAFGGFGAASTPAFGAPQQQQTPAFGFGASSASPFGAMSSPAFGAASTPAFGGLQSAPAFGAASAPAFGAVGSTPGAFGAPQSQPAFGFGGSPQSQPAFGAPQQSAPAFGGFGATSAPAFGAAASAPAFGAASSSAFSFGGTPTPAFGAASSASLFGAQSSTSLFGAASTPAFGAASTPSLFGAKPAAGGFSFPTPSSTPAFGAATSTPAPAFGATGGTSLFGTPQAATPAFSFASTPASTSFALVPAGQQQQQLGQPGMQQPAQPASVGANPYGALPTPPTLTPLPEYRVGLTQQQRHPLAPSSGGPPRPVALITPRSLTPRSGTNLRARQGTASLSSNLSRLSRSGTAELLGANVTTPGSVGGPQGANGSAPSLFVARDDPRRLFVREPLPSTEAAMGVSPTPYKAPYGSGLTPGRTGMKTPGAGLRPTPSTHRQSSEDLTRHASGSRPSPRDNLDDGGITDAELSALLPRLTRAEYYTEPSLSQLAAMGRDDPDNLASVSNFTIGRHGVGSVRWLDPTDVRCLDLDTIVSLNRGSIEVYLDESQKPEVGSGLNKPAEVTMLKVFKLDKETGQPTADPEAVERFTRKLKRVTADQGARFGSYDPSIGTWKFEVEHFSRYGLGGEDSEEDEGTEGYVMVEEEDDIAALGGGGAGFRGRIRPGPGARAVGFGKELEQNEMEEGSSEGEELPLGLASKFRRAAGGSQKFEAGDQLDRDAVAAQERQQQQQQREVGGLMSLQRKAATDGDATELQRIRDGLFGGPTRPHLAKQRRLLLVGDTAAPLEQQQPAAGALEGTVDEQPAAPLPITNWRKRHPRSSAGGGLTTGSSKDGLATGNQSSLLVQGTPATHGLSLPASGTTSKYPAAGFDESLPLCPVPAPFPDAVADVQGKERCLPDSGLFLGRSFRVGWAPKGVCIIPGGASLFDDVQGEQEDTTAATVSVHKLTCGSGVAGAGEDASEMVTESSVGASYEEVYRKRLEGQLKLQLEYSSPETPEEGGYNAQDITDTDAVAAATIPRWVLRCNRSEQLRTLTHRHMELCLNAAENESTSDVDRSVLRRQAAAWELVHALFATLPAEEQQQEEEEEQNDGDQQQPVTDLSRLIAFERRAQISRWLENRAKYKAENAVRAAASSPEGVADKVLALLTAHQIHAATAVAAAAGDVRLATLLSTAGVSEESRALLSAQIATWQTASFTQRIDPGLRAIYTILAGDINEVIPQLSLDWRGALGMHLWFTSEGSPASNEIDLEGALRSYDRAVHAKSAPPPRPGYIEDGLVADEDNHVEEEDPDDDDMINGDGGSNQGLTDVSYELLKLAAWLESGKGGDGYEEEEDELLGRLLRPAGVTPDPLDGAFSFFLIHTLFAVGAIDRNTPSPAVQRATLAFLTQLESLEGMSHWAIFVALHLPDGFLPMTSSFDAQEGMDMDVATMTTDGGNNNRRELLVKHLLSVYSPEWSANPSVQSFLLSSLRLPTSWLAAAKREWASAQNDEETVLHQAIAAKEWDLAHAVLIRTLAPSWLIAGQSTVSEHLLPVLDRLAPHSSAIQGWSRGGAIYLAFIHLWTVYKTPLSDTDSAAREERLATCKSIGDGLRELATRPPIEAATGSPGSIERGLAVRRAAVAFIAQRVAKWLAGDADGDTELLPSGRRVITAAGIRGLPLSGVGSSVALGAVSIAAGAT